MSVRILATAASGQCFREGGYALPAVEAGQKCIAAAGIDAGDIDVLINVGVYREENICEPAMAALIQNQLGLNTDPGEQPIFRKTFSFDLLNGACGVLSAVQAAAPLIENGSARYALIVCCDVHPGRRDDPSFPYAPTGAAMLLGRDEPGERGFRPIEMATAENTLGAMRGYTEIDRLPGKARGEVTLSVQSDFVDRALKLCVRTVRRTLQRCRVPLAKLRIVSSQPTPGFDAALARILEVDPRRFVDGSTKYGAAHTASLILGYHHGQEQGWLGAGVPVLFLGVGAGITCAAGLYLP